MYTQNNVAAKLNNIHMLKGQLTNLVQCDLRIAIGRNVIIQKTSIVWSIKGSGPVASKNKNWIMKLQEASRLLLRFFWSYKITWWVTVLHVHFSMHSRQHMYQGSLIHAKCRSSLNKRQSKYTDIYDSLPTTTSTSMILNIHVYTHACTHAYNTHNNASIIRLAKTETICLARERLNFKVNLMQSTINNRQLHNSGTEQQRA